VNKEQLQKAHEWFGEGKQAIIYTMRHYGIDGPFLVTAYNWCSSLAVNVEGDRHKWNMERAKEIVKRMNDE